MTKKRATFLVLALVGLLAVILVSKETKSGMKNDFWYSRYGNGIRVELTAASPGVPRNVSLVQGHRKLVPGDTRTDDEIILAYAEEYGDQFRINGIIENHSDAKIWSIVVDFIIINNVNKEEALRERMMIIVPVFKSESYRFAQSWKDQADSEVVKCANRIKDFAWSYRVVTVISDKSGESDIEKLHWACSYYKIRSTWLVQRTNE